MKMANRNNSGNNKKYNKLMRTKERLQMIALLFCASLAIGITPAFADKIGDAANGAANGIQQTAVGLVKPLIIIVVVVLGFAFLGVGGRRAKEEQKVFLQFLAAVSVKKELGVGLIVAAVPLSALVFGWF